MLDGQSGVGMTVDEGFLLIGLPIWAVMAVVLIVFFAGLKAAGRFDAPPVDPPAEVLIVFAVVWPVLFIILPAAALWQLGTAIGIVLKRLRSREPRQ